MKRTMTFVLSGLLAGAVFLASCQKKESASQQTTAAAYHIGVVTGTVSQSEDDLRGAE